MYVPFFKLLLFFNLLDVSIENLPNGYTYAGEVDIAFKPSGKGVQFRPSGRKGYSGFFKNGFKHGLGTLFYENGNKAYEGEFLKGLMSGNGIMYYDSGRVLSRGIFKNGDLEKGILFGINGEILANKTGKRK